MEKVYLLLRNNQQTGPYTYEELLQQQLLPTDLIWVEGRSAAWVYPSELATLISKSSSEKTKKKSPEASHGGQRTVDTQNASPAVPWYQNRKSPEAELEERALELRNRAQAVADQYNHRRTNSFPTHQRQSQRTVYEAEESPILLEVHTVSKKSVTLPQLIAAGVITALVAAGWYNREVLHIVRPQQNIVTQAAAPAVFQVSLPTPSKPAAIAVADTTPAEPLDTMAVAQAIAPSTAASRPKPAKEAAKKAETVTTDAAVTQPVAVQTTPAEKKEAPATDVTASKAAEKKDTAEATVAQASKEPEVEAAAPQKKKGLGQALKNIFKKKKKNDDKVAEEAPGTE